MTDKERKRRELRRRLSQILGGPVEVPIDPKPHPAKAYVAVRDDTQPGGGLVYVLDIKIMEDRELVRQGLYGQFGAEHVWFGDELSDEDVRKLIGDPNS